MIWYNKGVMKRDLILEKQKPYHIVVRAVERRTIFPSEEERARFAVQMYVANVGIPMNLNRQNVKAASEVLLRGQTISSSIVVQKHDPLVTFFSFALVGNHYHFGLIGSFDNAISKYLQKLNIGFSKFFNLKHRRIGSLFDTRFKAIAVTNPRQLAVLVRYINIKNVLDVYQPKWQEKGLHDVSGAARFLTQYRYSSFPDLFLERSSHFIPRTNLDSLREILGDEFLPRSIHIENEIVDLVKTRGVRETLPDFLLE